MLMRELPTCKAAPQPERIRQLLNGALGLPEHLQLIKTDILPAHKHVIWLSAIRMSSIIQFYSSFFVVHNCKNLISPKSWEEECDDKRAWKKQSRPVRALPYQKP